MRKRLFTLGLLAMTIFAIAVPITYLSVPTSNCSLSHFDAIIVVGWSNASDGTLSEMQRSRVLEGVSEYKAGRAAHIIMSGGDSTNGHTEAQLMAQAARTMGVPDKAVVLEEEASNTLGNIFFSQLIMKKEGWKSAEIISSQNHLPRLGVILTLYSFRWKTHPAPWPASVSVPAKVLYYAREIAATSIVRWFGFRSNDLVPL